jgi:hypothetical protein
MTKDGYAAAGWSHGPGFSIQWRAPSRSITAGTSPAAILAAVAQRLAFTCATGDKTDGVVRALDSVSQALSQLPQEPATFPPLPESDQSEYQEANHEPFVSEFVF